MNKRFALRILAAGLMVGAWVSAPQTVHAQGSSLFGSSGLTKSGTGGISGSLMGTGMTSGASGRGGSSGGLGGASPFGGQGQSPFGGQGQSPFGNTGAGASPFGNTMGANNSGMVGRNSGTFAGNSRAGQTAGGSGAGAVRNFGNTGNASQRGNNGQNSKPERTTSMIRPRQRVAFEYAEKSPAVLATQMSTRMGKIGRKNPALKGVEIKVDGDQLVLTGKVKNADQSRLAAILLRQEPGVKSIRNELEIEQPTVTE